MLMALTSATAMMGTALIATPVMLPEGPQVCFRESASAEGVFLLPGLTQPRIQSEENGRIYGHQHLRQLPIKQ